MGVYRAEVLDLCEDVSTSSEGERKQVDDEEEEEEEEEVTTSVLAIFAARLSLRHPMNHVSHSGFISRQDNNVSSPNS